MWCAFYCRHSVKSSEVLCDFFCGLMGIARAKFTGRCVAWMGKTVWTVATSCGAHSSWRQFHEECAPPGDVATVHTVFPIHTTHSLWTSRCYALWAHKNRNSMKNAHHPETLLRSIQYSPYTPHMSLWISLGLCALADKNRTTLRCSSYVDSKKRAIFVV